MKKSLKFWTLKRLNKSAIIIEKQISSDFVQRQRWNFPFKSLEIAKMYLRSADFTMKQPCGIYEIASKNDRLFYKIFANDEDLRVYLKKNRDKSCKDEKAVFRLKEFKEFEHTQMRKLNSEEVQKYISEC